MTIHSTNSHGGQWRRDTITVCVPSTVTGERTRDFGSTSGPELRKSSPGIGYSLSNLSLRFSLGTSGLTFVSMVKIHYDG